MICKFRPVFKAPDDIWIAFKNMIALFVMQGTTYLLPLVTVPYLLHTIGLEKFGILAVAAAVSAYFAILTDYGFNLSASGRIAVKQHDINEVIDIFNAVLSIKIMLLLLNYIILNIILTFSEKIGQHSTIYQISFLGVVGQAIFPIWLYQGLEKLQLVTYLNTCTRIIFTLLVFVLVKDEADYMLVALLNAGSSLTVGVLSLLVAVRNLNMKFKLPQKKQLIQHLGAGWHIFTSAVAINAYTTSAMIIVGIFENSITAGVFATVEKIITAIKGLTSPLTQAIYPTIKKRISNDRRSGIKASLKICVIASFILFLGCLFVFSSSNAIMKLITGQENSLSNTILRIMIFVPVLTLVSNFLGVQILLNLGYEKEFRNILIFASIIGFSIISICGYNWGAVGVSIGVLSSEVLVVLLMAVSVMRKKNDDRTI